MAELANIDYGVPDCVAPYGRATKERGELCVETRDYVPHITRLSPEERFNNSLKQHISAISTDTLQRMLQALDHQYNHGGTQSVDTERNLRNLLGVNDKIPLPKLLQILMHHKNEVAEDIQTLQISANDFSRTGGNSDQTIASSNNALNLLKRAQEIQAVLHLASQAVNNIIALNNGAKAPQATGYGRQATVHGGGAVPRQPTSTPQAELDRIPASMQ